MIESVLVLNANFEPVHVCDIRRALSLIYTQKAALIQNGRGEFHTVSRSYPIPSIIRLQNMIHRPRPIVQLSRHEILRRDHYTCQYCGKHGGILTIDHIIPKNAGGRHTWTNLVAACISCNHRKAARTPQQAGMELIRLPIQPPTSVFYYFEKYLNENEEWEPFLTGW